MICLNSSTRAVRSLTPATYLWVISLIEATTPSKHSNYYYASSSSIPLTLLYWEVTMRPGRSPLFTVSTTRLLESMEMLTLGNIVPRSLTISASGQSSKEKFSAFTEVFPLKSRLLIKLDWLIDAWRFLMKVHSVISCGLIQKRSKHGQCLQEELVGYLGQE